MFAPAQLGMSSKTPTCMNLITTEGQALDHQFPSLSKVLQKSIQTLSSWGNSQLGCWGGLESFFSPLCGASKSKAAGEGAGVFLAFCSQMGKRRSLRPNLLAASCFQGQSIIYIGFSDLRQYQLSPEITWDLGVKE